MTYLNDLKTLKTVALAGIAGGMAEMLWIISYSSATATDGAVVARQVTASIWHAAGEWALAPALGIAIHLVLSIALAAIAIPLLSRIAQRSGAGLVLVSAVFVLALVWAVNFFFILPLLNPAFVKLMPYSVTLVSKLLFGITMGFVFCSVTPERVRFFSVRRT